MCGPGSNYTSKYSEPFRYKRLYDTDRGDPERSTKISNAELGILTSTNKGASIYWMPTRGCGVRKLPAKSLFGP